MTQAEYNIKQHSTISSEQEKSVSKRMLLLEAATDRYT